MQCLPFWAISASPDSHLTKLSFGKGKHEAFCCDRKAYSEVPSGESEYQKMSR